MNDSPVSTGALQRVADAEANLARVRDELWQTPLPMTDEQRNRLDAAKIELHRAQDDLEISLKHSEAVLQV